MYISQWDVVNAAELAQQIERTCDTALFTGPMLHTAYHMSDKLEKPLNKNCTCQAWIHNSCLPQTAYCTITVPTMPAPANTVGRGGWSAFGQQDNDLISQTGKITGTETEANALTLMGLAVDAVGASSGKLDLVLLPCSHARTNKHMAPPRP